MEPEPVSLGLALELFPSPRAPSPRCGKDWRASESRQRIRSLSLAPCDPNFRHPPPHRVTKHESGWFITGAIVSQPCLCPALRQAPHTVSAVAISTSTLEETEAQGAKSLPDSRACALSQSCRAGHHALCWGYG